MPTSTIERGDIWLVEFDPARGAEIQKTRPAIVMGIRGVGRLDLQIVVPVTSWQPRYSRLAWFVRLMPDTQNGLSNESAADTFQIKSLSEERFVRRLGNLTDAQINAVAKAIALCVGYTLPTK